MKFPALKFVFALFLSILSPTSIAATLVDRADFGAAVEFGFDTFAGDLNPGDGNFSAQGGFVRGLGDINFTNEGITEPLAYFGSGNQIDFTFADPVSAFGLNFAFNSIALNSVERYRFFTVDSSNNELESITLNSADFSPCSGTTFFVCGFIGLDAGSNQISSAGFQKLSIFSSFGPTIDNVIYETVPTPGILWLLSTGFLGLYWNRKQKFS